jgi:PAS domain S-box-containing protein
MIDPNDFQMETRHFQVLIQNLADLVTVHDSSGVIRYATPSSAKLLGYPHEELIGKNAFELIHPDDMGMAQAAFEQVVGGSNAGSPTEYRVRRSDGSWLYIETVGTNFMEDTGIRGIVLTSRDITERKMHEQERQAIVTASGALRNASTRAEMMPIILDQVIQLLSIDGAAIFMRNADTGDVIVELGRGRSEGLTGLHLPASDEILTHVIVGGQPFYSEDLHSEFQSVQSALLAAIENGRIASACLPLKSHEHTIGALWVQKSREGQQGQAAIDEGQLQVLATIADMAANAIHRATLAEQTELRLHRLTVLQTIDLAISSSMDLQVTLKLLLGQIASRLHIDAAQVLVMDRKDGAFKCEASRGFMTAFMKRSELQLGQELARQALMARRTIHVAEIAKMALAPDTQKILETEGFVTYYGVPLIATGRTVGVLELFQRRPLPKDTEWVNYLDGLAAHVAFAIEKVSLIQSLQLSNSNLIKAYEGVIAGWSRALALRGHETEAHTRRVTEQAVWLAQLTGVQADALLPLRRGATLHDIGEIALPDAVLAKPEPLSEDEWDLVRQHPLHAHELIWPIECLRSALDIPYCHHEKWDGSGYPQGLRQEEIPVPAQLFSILDVFDALTSDRPYRAAWPRAKALEYIQEQSGKAFSPRFVAAFLNNIEALPLAG